MNRISSKTAALIHEMSTDRSDLGQPHYWIVYWQKWPRPASPLNVYWQKCPQPASLLNCPLTEVTSACLTTELSTDRSDFGQPYYWNVCWQKWLRRASQLNCPLTEVTSACSSDRSDTGLPHCWSVDWQNWFWPAWLLTCKSSTTKRVFSVV
jgi:hypothetical protein